MTDDGTGPGHYWKGISFFLLALDWLQSIVINWGHFLRRSSELSLYGSLLVPSVDINCGIKSLFLCMLKSYDLTQRISETISFSVHVIDS